ncbi:C6 transcription factor-like protein [Polyplosphaeria fusca]|uniref:C6 transcription factor-like protein n=1 Tax=Polyplosphaeria fusca TaxID=682080 RepID=A0A9P4V4G8_9PLEO|nr:C6 transcription factor-like protein [Polyplosphaeria fusca]
MAASTSSIQNRPYRSHRVPACSRCRSRKIRCHIDIPNQPCLSCRQRQLKCLYLVDAPAANADSGEQQSKRRRLTPGHGNLPPPVLHKTGTDPSASVLLPPHLAEDVEILQRHISLHEQPSGETPGRYQTLYSDASNPIVYLSVPRFRAGLRPENSVGMQQLEIIEQILGPFKSAVIDLYFEQVHPHFPLLDDDTRFNIRQGLSEKVPKNLACVIYAIGIIYWRKSDILKLHPMPDAHYIWNKAISSVLEDFLSPSMSTIQAASLDQIGRPSVSLVGNVTLCGRTVALAQTFGLHRDCSEWKISDNEKSVRLRLWWGVLINDYWASVAYGIPPRVVFGFYDVPRPRVETVFLPSKASPAEKCATICFIHLCALTELLGDILPLVYHVKPEPIELEKSVQQLKNALAKLESELPEWLPLPHQTGTSNLWLCFLSIRLLLSRVALRASILLRDPDLQTARMDDLCASTVAVIDFVLFLGEYQFLDFWLPYAAHLLVLAVSVSLRCAVEARNVEERNSSISRLERLMSHLERAREDHDWDIANYCLERHSESISKLSLLAAQSPQPEAPGGNTKDNVVDEYSALEDNTFLLSDMLDPNSFDFSWEALWDTASGMPTFCNE